MVTGTFGLGVFVVCLLLALIGIRSGDLILEVTAVVAIIWFSTTTEIRQVTVQGNQKYSGVHVATPWGEPTYSYGGEEFPIPTDCEVAVVNLTEGYEVELYRNGMEVLFGLISISREHVMVPPGGVACIDGSIKAERNAHGSYFTMKVFSLADGEEVK